MDEKIFSVKRRRFAIFDGSKTKYIDGKTVKMKPGIKSSVKYSVKNVGWRAFDGTFLILAIWGMGCEATQGPPASLNKRPQGARVRDWSSCEASHWSELVEKSLFLSEQ